MVSEFDLSNRMAGQFTPATLCLFLPALGFQIYTLCSVLFLGAEIRTQVLMLTHPVPYWLPSYVDPTLSKKYAHVAFLDGSDCTLKTKLLQFKSV